MYIYATGPFEHDNEQQLTPTPSCPLYQQKAKGDMHRIMQDRSTSLGRSVPMSSSGSRFMGLSVVATSHGLPKHWLP